MQDALSHRNYGSIIVLAWKHLLSPCNLHFSCFFWEFHGSQWPSIFHNISCISSVCLVIPCLSIYLFFLSASPMHSGFQLICLSNQYLACRHLCIASAVSTAPLHLTAWAVFSSKLNSSSSLCLKSLFLSFNILKLIFSAFYLDDVVPSGCVGLRPLLLPGTDGPQDGWRMLSFKVKSLLAAHDKLQQSRSVVRRGAKGLEKYGFKYRVCVTLFKDHRVNECDEQRYFSFYFILAPFITRTLLVCLFS